MSRSKSRNKPIKRLFGSAEPEIQKRIAEILRRFAKINPDPKCELYYETPFQLLVSVVLSAQATDKMVNRCMEPVYRQGFDPQTVISWGTRRLLAAIRSIGLAPTKARNIHKIAIILVQNHGSTVPSCRRDLEKLPGIGRKSANVILGELFGRPTLAVDTHVLRVTKRLGLHGEDDPTKAEAKLLAIIDPGFLPRAHHWFVLHGRYVCKSRAPDCAACPLRDICPMGLSNLPGR